ncbi:DUF3429 domain-containing protein [Phenylobacterium montanum]|uniref:DUF3429 domain-containing protein n=1 Tax=Phenylobacterium montanum TaxID=2823693 RepID=A0A975G2W7_9CAUL|nr:DUF3429 domain-containing protein [Caulobacter sp. S6]QUD89794.1 DUF3429 domain-containing protein [Caulobacter sp. S6]
MPCEPSRRERDRPPAAARLLGWLGVAPFLAPAAAKLLGAPLWGPEMIWRSYGAIILAFMGGAQWGLAVGADPGDAHGQLRRYSISILPALTAWGSLALAPRPSLAVQLCGFAALLAYDLWTVRIGRTPSWYGRLRIQLSAAVSACLAVGVVRGGWS